MKDTKKIMVAYYSYSGNTKEAAEVIARQVGGELFEIQTVDAYPSVYSDVTAQAKKELNAGFRPKIKDGVRNMAQYDLVFIGSPVWWGTVAPAVMTFLSENDLSDKTVIPFVTHEGSGMARSAKDIQKQAPRALVTAGEAFGGREVSSSHKLISQWAQGSIE